MTAKAIKTATTYGQTGNSSQWMSRMPAAIATSTASIRTTGFSLNGFSGTLRTVLEPGR